MVATDLGCPVCNQTDQVLCCIDFDVLNGVAIAKLTRRWLEVWKSQQSAEFLPRGVFQRPNGWGVQLYRVTGSALGEVEVPLGCGESIDDAVADAKARGNWPSGE